MACACKVNQDLAYLRRRHGRKMPKNNKTSIRDNFGNILSDLLVKTISIVAIPFVVIDVFLTRKRRRGGVIRITDFAAFSKLKK